MERALGDDFPNITVLTRSEFRDEQQATVDQFLTVLVALLALSAIIAILGIINTLALSVFERTHELGLLRVVGMSRRQVRRMVRWESVVIAVVGAVVGLALGVLWGWAFARALRDQGLSVFRIPSARWSCSSSASMVAGVIAAVLPAWRASRPRRPRSDRDRMTNDRISNRKSVWTRRISALALAGFAITAGGCLGEPSASVAPNDLSSGHTVLLIGDSLMGGAAFEPRRRARRRPVGGISIVDAHLNGSGLVRPMDGMLPDRLRRGAVRSPPRHRRRRHGVGRRVREALSRVRDAGVLPGVARQRGRRARGRQCARSPAHRRAAAPAPTRVRATAVGLRVHRRGGERARSTSAGRRAVRPRPIGGRRSRVTTTPTTTRCSTRARGTRCGSKTGSTSPPTAGPERQRCSPPRSKPPLGMADRYERPRSPARVLDWCGDAGCARRSPSRAVSSGVEHFPDTEGVRGSNPLPPTIKRRSEPRKTDYTYLAAVRNVRPVLRQVRCAAA